MKQTYNAKTILRRCNYDIYRADSASLFFSWSGL